MNWVEGGFPRYLQVQTTKTRPPAPHGLLSLGGIPAHPLLIRQWPPWLFLRENGRRICYKVLSVQTKHETV